MRYPAKVAAAVVLAMTPAGAAPIAAQEIRARTGTSLVLGARVQVQYEAPSTEGVPGTFFIRRAWVTMDGTLNERVAGRVQFNAQGSSVLEAYLELKPSDAFQLQIGQFKKAMSYFWLAANSDLPLIERDGRVTGVDHCPGVGSVCSFGRFTGALGLDNYEPGVLMTGRFAGRRLGYRFTLTNGEGLSTKDVNTAKSASGRVSVYLADNTRLSGYFALDETLDSRGETMNTPAYGAEFEFGTWRQGAAHSGQRDSGPELEAERRGELLRLSADGPLVPRPPGGNRTFRHRALAADQLGRFRRRGSRGGNRDRDHSRCHVLRRRAERHLDECRCVPIRRPAPLVAESPGVHLLLGSRGSSPRRANAAPGLAPTPGRQPQPHARPAAAAESGGAGPGERRPRGRPLRRRDQLEKFAWASSRLSKTLVSRTKPLTSRTSRIWSGTRHRANPPPAALVFLIAISRTRNPALLMYLRPLQSTTSPLTPLSMIERSS